MAGLGALLLCSGTLALPEGQVLQGPGSYGVLNGVSLGCLPQPSYSDPMAGDLRVIVGQVEGTALITWTFAQTMLSDACVQARLCVGPGNPFEGQLHAMCQGTLSGWIHLEPQSDGTFFFTAVISDVNGNAERFTGTVI
jgi:hypothetical protein